ncbi:Breast cancer type 2 susceptibility like protein [Astathelohania contejeani]|uniref:Breast cancer type 2 susceptibility like protein n=1 Tax=Astathelohania contejeani TaxID=164912 RepID=A0ABQ7I2Y9_9MICR|nr:Breast cancer type 2 susceptibility like protein [Thelohania contejeani]
MQNKDEPTLSQKTYFTESETDDEMLFSTFNSDLNDEDNGITDEDTSLSFSSFLSEEEASKEGVSGSIHGTSLGDTKDNSSFIDDFFSEIDEVVSSDENRNGILDSPNNIFVEKKIETGFKTATNKIIKISEESLKKVNLEKEVKFNLNEIDDKLENIIKLRKEGGNGILNNKRKISPNVSQKRLSVDSGLIRSFNKPEIGHKSIEELYIKKMENIYANIKEFYKNEPLFWINQQFRWSWMSMYMRGIANEDKVVLQEKIIEQMNIRKSKEYSILRRIVEGDDISWKYMILLVVEIQQVGRGDYLITVYDGYYGIYCKVDDEIARRIVSQKFRVGTRLKVFGAELLLSTATPIEELKEPGIKLRGNGVRIDRKGKKNLGYQNKLSFITRIDKIKKGGGPVSCIEVKVVRLVEKKYLIRVDNYESRVEERNLEKEIEKIEKLREEANHKKETKVVLKRYIKMIVHDLHGDSECLITWWNPEEIKTGDKIRFVYLMLMEKSIGIHLTSTNKTHFKIIK